MILDDVIFANSQNIRYKENYFERILCHDKSFPDLQPLP